MWNRKDKVRRFVRREKTTRKLIPSIETVESRVVLSGSGFLQGTVFVDANANDQLEPDDTPLAGALVQLVQGGPVVSYCKTLSNGSSNPKACAQVLSTAICAYVTDSNLAGDAGASCGFTVTANGLGASTWHVGSSGSSLGLSGNQTCSILTLLQQVDSQSRNGAINSGACNAANSLFSGVTQC